MNRSHHPRSGTALVASLMVVATIAALGAYMVQIRAEFAKRQDTAIDRKCALYVAEAGLAEAVLAISQGKSGELGTEAVPVRFHEGVYWVESEALLDGRRMLTSRALVGTGQFAVQLVVLPNVHQVGSLGFFGTEGVVIGDGVVVDGYDARLGRYDVLRDQAYVFCTSGAGGLVRSNGDIVVDDAAAWPANVKDPFGQALDALPAPSRTLYDGVIDPYVTTRMRQTTQNKAPRTTYLFGDVMPGPERSLVTSGATKISMLDRAERAALLPPVVVPQTTRTVHGRTRVSNNKVIGETSARYDQLVVVGGGQLTLRGPAVLHLGRFEVESAGKVTLDDRLGPILVVVESALRFEFGSVLTTVDEDMYRSGTYIFLSPDADPSNDSRVTLECCGDFRGMLYTPGDKLMLPAMLRVWGAVVAKHLKIADGAWLTYDDAFRMGGEGVPIFPQQRTWQILDEAVTERRVGFDPLRELARLGIEPLTALNAAPEQNIELRYFDGTGTRRTYTGAASGIDFSTLERVIGIQWQDPVTATYSELQRPSGVDPDNLIESFREVRREAQSGQ